FGLLPFLLFMGGLFFIRQRIYWSLAIPAITLMWLSAAGWFATALYYIWPGMNMVRHIGGFNSITAMLMLLGSGFVLQRLHDGLGRGMKAALTNHTPSKISPLTQWLLATLLILAMAADVAMHDGARGLANLMDSGVLNDLRWRAFFLFRIGALEIGLLILIIWRLLPLRDGAHHHSTASTGIPPANRRGHHLALLLLLIVALDIGSYRVQIHLGSMQYEAGAWDHLFQSSKSPYHPQRIYHPESDSRGDDAIALASAKTDYFNIQYAMSLYPFAHLDPCFPQMIKTKIQVMNLPVERMLAGLFDDNFFSKLNIKSIHTPAYFRDFHRADFISALGCESNKLTLLRHPKIAKDDAHTRALFKNSDDMERTLILNAPSPELLARIKSPETEEASDESNPAVSSTEGWSESEVDDDSLESDAAWDAMVDGSIQVTQFSANRIGMTVIVSDGEPAWLLYRDGYHPHWRAWRNGLEEPVAQANMGFKALWIPPGEHQVRFEFDHGLMKTSGHLLIGISALGALTLIGVMLAAALNRRVSGGLS
ncbi:MAG: hypothetical protein HQL53_10680, partial [Magnetococcales bacterium]|nr:hypothetical protein [Magnetococcales bacterium]